MKILVSGGRGFIGSRIVQTLASAGGSHEVHILSRRPGAVAAVPNVTVRVGDVTEPATLSAACAGMEVVIHAVQFPNHPIEDPRKGWTYLHVDGEGTSALVAAATVAQVRRFIYLSGVGDAPGRTEPWFRAKRMAEAAIRASGMEYVIFRPSMVYGPGDRSLNRFIGWARSLPFLPVIGDGRSRLAPVYVGELAALVVQALDLPAATDQTFEVGGAEELTMDALLRRIARLVGKQRPLLHIPKGLVKTAAALLQYFPGRPITPSAVDFLTMDIPVDPSRTRAVFGWRPASLEENVRSYLSDGR